MRKYSIQSSGKNINFNYQMLILLVFVALLVSFCTAPKTDNTAQQQVPKKTTQISSADIDSSMNRAFRFLARTQQGDGTWIYQSAKDKAFKRILGKKHPPLYGVMNVIVSLQHTPYQKTDTYRKGLKYILENQLNSDPYWTYDGKDHAYSKDKMYIEAYKFDPKNPPLLEPDIGMISLGWMATAANLQISEATRQKVVAELEKYKDKETGLYKGFLDDYYGDLGWSWYDYGNEPSIGANIQLLGAFEQRGIDGTALNEAIVKAMQVKDYWKQPDYFRLLSVMADMASNGVMHNCESCKPIMKQLISDFEQEFQNQSYKDLVNTELACYIKAKSHLCFLEDQTCKEGLKAAVIELCERQRLDGSWKVAGLYEAGYFPERAKEEQWKYHEFFGSSAETTSIALKALYFYKNLSK